MKRILRLLAVLLLVELFLAAAFAARAVVRDPARRRRSAVARAACFSRWLLAWTGVRVFDDGGPAQPAPGGALCVSNHLSYLDILVLLSVGRFVFVTSREMGRRPLLGVLARLGGCVFVERRNPASIRQDIAQIRLALEQGFQVMLFPEGTSHDGRAVRPFHSALFEAAVEARVPIVPFCVNYRQNDQSLSRPTADKIFWYGGAPFLRQAWRLLSVGSLSVRVTRLEPIPAGAPLGRKERARAAEQRIRRAFLPIP